MGVTAIDDDVALLDAALVDEQLDELVDGLAGLHEQHHPSRLLELGHELLDAVCADDGLALGLVVQEAVDLADGAVEGDDGEAVVGHVEDQVLAHDGQADEAEISSGVILISTHTSEVEYGWKKLRCVYGEAQLCRACKQSPDHSGRVQ